MYLNHFKLTEHPFRLTPDPAFLYLSKDHTRAKAFMDYSTWSRDGFVVITGEVGAGKTTLIQTLLSEFDDGVLVAKIFQTQLNEVEFLQAVLVAFGLNPFKANKPELMDMLTGFLVDSFLQSKRVVLIVDEAQNLTPVVLEEIRLLAGLETQKEKLLQVVLVGQPQLDAMLDRPGMEQLRQRVRFRCRIRALNPMDTRAYIRHRLSVAGRRDLLFLDDTLPLIYKFTGGIPRLINSLCDTALACAFADNATQIGAKQILDALDELQWRPYSERLRLLPSVRTSATPATGTPPSLVTALQHIALRMASIERLLVQIFERLESEQEAKTGTVPVGIRKDRKGAAL